MPNPFGSRYGGAKRRADVLRGSQLAPLVRAAEASATPKPLVLTSVRRGCLEAIAAGVMKWYPTTAQWRSGGKARSAVVHDVCAAGWAHQTITGDHRLIELTDLGRAALGLDEPA